MNTTNEVRASKASNGLRFLNFILDRLVIYAAFFIVGALAMAIYQFTGIQFFADIIDGMSNVGRLTDLFVTNLIYLSYLFSMEYFANGRTIGKFITGTKAISNDGAKLSAEQAFIRTISRIVPFEAFSFFGENGWHDKWSSTSVVSVSKYTDEVTKNNDINQIGAKEVA